VTASGPPSVDVSILVTTFRRPRHLALVLESIALQRLRGTTVEIVVSDDGSGDETPHVVRAFATSAGIAVRYASQPHDGFRLARARNAAARLARGRYLLFLDGDCMIPRHHVAAHVARRRSGTALLGYCARLTEEASRTLLPENLAVTDFGRLVTDGERRSLARRHRKAWWHAALRHPSKPRLAGGDFGVWRDDFIAVNGFDERFVGWGQEDDDLGMRLRGLGVRLESILDRTRSLHVWHETDPTATRRWRDGTNVARFERRGRLVACRAGLVDRPAAAITWGLPANVGDGPLGRTIAGHLTGARLASPGERCEIDVAIGPGAARFSRPAECRLLLVAAGHAADPAALAAADQVAEVTDEESVARVLDAAG
jgi:glycosyltransferase involved in cell wall biosynthesis